MSALVPTRRLADSLADLFEPVDAEPLAALLAEYRDRRDTLARVASVFADDQTRAVLRYFADGNDVSDRGGYISDRMFELPGAIKALNATYWQRALEATDVLDVMPAERRKQWRQQIERRDVPEFTDAAIRATIAEHLAARHRYFAERVDGIFQALSPDHVTNLPTGFRSKLILNYVFDSYGFSTQSRLDVLTDLRIVVARFMGRDVGEGHVLRQLTGKLIDYARRVARGEWVSVDGGAIEVKAHKCGTCHVRVHDEIAWRLNAVLAYLHPGAIPESARTRPRRRPTTAKRTATPELMTRPLPFAVLRALAEFKPASARLCQHNDGTWTYGYGWRDLDKHVRAELCQVLASIGGVDDRGDWGAWKFDYDPSTVLAELIASGCVPDQRAHQFYPTPRSLAERVVAAANIGPNDRVLEPSAGQGAIAELLPVGTVPGIGTDLARTICIEASALHVAVLRAKGLDAIHADFIVWAQLAKATHVSFDRVVMNPPFDRGQWVQHVQHAARLLPGRGARLVAILPASAPKRLDLPGFALTWSEPIEGAFAGTNISVVILVAERCDG